MKILERDNYQSVIYKTDTIDIKSDCQTIMFENIGETDCNVYIDDITHEHISKNTLRVLSGHALTLGNMADSIIQHVFDVVFDNIDTYKALQVVRESFALLT